MTHTKHPKSPELNNRIKNCSNYSLFYSGVDRPTFTIDKALDSSLDLRRAKEQLRGEFQTEEDRIKSLFATKNDK